MAMLDAALEYIAQGFKVFPCCWPNNDHLCECGRNHIGRDIGKVPLTPKGFKDFTETQIGVREYWTRWPGANIGIMPDGFYVFDIDADHGGLESYAKLIQLTGEFKTRTIRTGGGGLHLYLKGEHRTVPSFEGYPGLEIRGTRTSYVIAPPSLHKSGKYYLIENGIPISEAPAGFTNLIKSQRTIYEPLSTETKIYEGSGRNVWLTTQQGILLNSLRDRELVKATIRTLNQTCCVPPLAESELQRTLFKSLPKWGIKEKQGEIRKIGGVSVRIK